MVLADRVNSDGTGERGAALVSNVVDSIRRSASLFPAATALVDGDTSVSYGDLDTRSDAIAALLSQMGVQPESIVGVYLGRSVEFVEATLGILKAGGGYLPLDPTHPVDRLTYILEDARVPLIVTNTSLAGSLPQGPWQIVAVDDAVHGTIADDLTLPAISDHHLAYVIYTSGSTGRPKGVQITHGSLQNLVDWHNRAFDVTPADRATQASTLAFDAAVWEIWPHLSAGATVYLPSDDVRSDSAEMHAYILRHGITISFLPTAIAERIIRMAWPEDTPLRVLLTGADTLHSYPPLNLPFVFVNNYGPTENTVVTTSGSIPPDPSPSALPSIGKPIDNTQVYLLDDDGREVANGEIGEMFIGGRSLARGYLNRPELTAEKFVQNRFSGVPDDRLYRTGDLARYRADGTLEFLGRADQQVKVRGYRVELNEIVSALNKLPGVQESAVTAVDDTQGDKRLVAYVVSLTEDEPTASAMRDGLLQLLPEYMVPSAYVRISGIPLTHNGKVDQDALPAPDEDNILRDDEFVAPRSPVEEKLTEIVASLLGLDRVSVNDNFFLLGGHSLLGAQVIARIRDTFGVELTLRTIFDSPTVEELAAEVEQGILRRLESMTEEEAQELLA